MSDPAEAAVCEDCCPKCGAYLEWEDCDECGGEGWEDRYDEDPLWYGHELYRCSLCEGSGGWWYCPECTSIGGPDAR